MSVLHWNVSDGTPGIIGDSSARGLSPAAAPPPSAVCHLVQSPLCGWLPHLIPGDSIELQLALNSIGQFTFSPGMTVVKHLCHKWGLYPELDVSLDGHQLPIAETVHFLGHHFDSNLTWFPHIQKLKAKYQCWLNCLQCLQGSGFGTGQWCSTITAH